MLKDLFIEWRAQATERIRNPLLGAFTGAWVVVNWRLIAVISLSDTTIEDRITFIEAHYINIHQLLYAPAIFAFAFTLLFPWVSFGIQYIQEHANIRRRKHKLIIDTEYLKASVGRAQAQAQLNLILAKEQLARGQQEEIEALRKQLLEQQEVAQSKVSAREAELEKARQDYEALIMAEGADADKQREEVQKTKAYLEEQLRRAEAERERLTEELRVRQRDLEGRLMEGHDFPFGYRTNEMTRMLVSAPYRLYFNPKRGAEGSKRMRFSPDGRIVEGGNRNEHSWRVLDGQLELLQADGTVHSRFNYSPGHGMFFHTNDPDTKSLRDQYMAPEETQS